MAKWKFKRMEKGDVLKDPTETEFFTTEQIGGLSAALVRESIQNTMDAKSNPDKPAVIQFTFSGSENAIHPNIFNTYLEGLKKHLQAKNNGLNNEELPNFNKPAPYLLVEDFNTEGLEGDPNEYEDPPEEEESESSHNFFWFWRNIGRSAKGGQDRGRWGIGKTVFPASSRINTYYGFSIVESNLSANLMGQSILKIHNIKGEKKRINPYGHFGLFNDEEDPYFVTPITANREIEGFISYFEFQRTLSAERKKPGLSVLIPYPSQKINTNDIIKSVCIQYFYAILANDLVVKTINPDDNIYEEINSDNIISIIDKISFNDQEYWNNTKLKKLYDFSIWANHINKEELIKLNKPPEIENVPQWRDSWYKTDDFMELIESKRNQFKLGERIAFSIPVKVHEKGGSPSYSHFQVYLEKDDSLSRSECHIIRDGITITGIQPSNKRDLRALLIINDRELANLLGDAENPAHTEWQKNSRNFKGKYVDGDKVISFVVNSIDYCYSLLQIPSEGLDKDSLKDIFSIANKYESETRISGVEEGEQEEEPDIPSPDIDPTPKPYMIHDYKDGFKIVPGNDVDLKTTIEVNIAYQIPKKNPLTKYDTDDFDLSHMFVSYKGVKIHKREENVLIFTILSHEFEVQVTGFDRNRDLYIKASIQ